MPQSAGLKLRCRSSLQRRCWRTNSATSSSVPASTQQTQNNTLLLHAVEALLTFPPVWNLAAAKARERIVKRGLELGQDWQVELAQLRQRDWDAAMQNVAAPQIQYPSYYTKPFHAYPQGNLSWDAALEVSLAAKSVHATVMDPNGKIVDPEGDFKLRSSCSDCTVQLLQQMGARPVRDVVDMGCAAGLSSFELMRVFPTARITGVDLSPYFLTVANYMQEMQGKAIGEDQLNFVHAPAESTGLPDGSADLVSMVLVCHELPVAATEAIFKEAFRILRPGGALAVMDMNPSSPVWQKVFSNPFAFTAFKSTEPWLTEYVSLDIKQAYMNAGFGRVEQLENSPRHRTLVGLK